MDNWSFSDKVYHAINDDKGKTALVLTSILLGLGLIGIILSYVLVLLGVGNLDGWLTVLTSVPVVVVVILYVLMALSWFSALAISLTATHKESHTPKATNKVKGMDDDSKGVVTVQPNVDEGSDTVITRTVVVDSDDPDEDYVPIINGKAVNPNTPAPTSLIDTTMPEDSETAKFLGNGAIKELLDFSGPDQVKWSELDIKNYIYASYPVEYKSLGGSRPSSFRDPQSGRTYLLLTDRDGLVSITFKCGRNLADKLVANTNGVIAKAKFPSGVLWYDVTDISRISVPNLKHLIDLSHSLTNKGF